MFILSLGTIVRTDAKKAIGAFQALANDLGLGIQVPSLMPQLQPLFIDFNLGKISVTDFKESVTSVFFAQAQNKDDRLREIFLEKFESCWNAMCEIDPQSVDVFKYIANQSGSEAANSITIYSDTNPLHFVHLGSALRQGGLDPYVVYTTFDHKCAKEALLLKMVNTLRDSGSAEMMTLVLGQYDKITDPVLLEMTKQRDVQVLNVASSAGVMIEVLTESRVNVQYLELLMSRRRSRSGGDRLTLAFDTMRLGQALPGVDTTPSPTAEPTLERKRSPSPT